MRTNLFTLLSSAAAVAIVAQPALAQDADHSRTYRFEQPAQELGDALIAFSRVTQLQIASSPADVRGLRSPPVRGEMTAQAALARMTRELPVDARIAGRTVTVARRTAAATGTNVVAHNRPTPAERRERQDMPYFAPASEPEEIVVTGYRESLDQALVLKKQATGSKEVILAEDIGSFPDQNLAEALQRVPGVAISRDSGEGRQISLRGLGPEFTRTQMNGMEVLSNTASGLDSRSGASRTRSFDYNVFASELFNQVVVEKSYSAEQDEGGIGGTVALRTAKPFDYGATTLVASAKLQSNQYTETLTPRLVALAFTRSDDFGALVSAAYSSADTIEWGYRNWNWSRMNFGAGNVGPAIDSATRDLLVNATGDDRVWNSRAQTYASWFNHRERLGLTGTLQYNPDDATDVTLDVLYGRLTNDRDEHVIGNAGTNGLSANDVRGTQVLQDVTIDQYNSIIAATVSGVDVRSESKPTQDRTDFWQVALNGRTAVTDSLTFTGLAGWSSSVFDSRWDRVYLESVGHTVSFTGLDTQNPVNSYDFDPADPAAWDLQSLQWREDHIESEFYTAGADLAWSVAEGSVLKAGGEFKKFENSGYRYNASANFENRNALASLPTMLTPYSTAIPYVVADVAATFAALGIDSTLDDSDLSAGTNYSLTEQTWAAFLQYDLQTQVGGMGLRANIGVRYYDTELVSRGSSVTNAGLVPVEITSRYDGFLPALNIALDVTPELVVRFSANRNISRPGLGELSAAATVRVAGYGGTISAGNPYLTPYTANSIEGSVEYYDGTRGFLGIGLFYKDMESFVTTETATVPYSETGFPLSLLEDGQDGSIVFNFTRPVNGPGASIRGVEVSGKRDFDFLPAPFDAFGALANVTYADGTTDVYYNDVPYELTLVDLSKWSYNATLYYDTERAGARVSLASRDRYRKGNGGNNNIGEYFAPSTVLDATAYFNVTPRIQLRVEALNLTDEPILHYADTDAKRLMTSTFSGRTLTFGASIRF